MSTDSRSGVLTRIVSLLTCAAVLLVFAPRSSALQDRGEESGGQPTGLSSLQKSLILPGWGQLAEKRYLEGLFFLTAEAFCIYQVVRFNHKGNTYYSDYQNAAGVDDAVRFRKLTEDSDKSRNLYLLGAAAVWAVNLLDIYVIVKNKQKIRLQYQRVGKKGMALSLRIAF